MVQPGYYSPVHIQQNSWQPCIVFILIIYCINVWYFRWLLCHKKYYLQDHLILSRIINPSLKSENPACLFMPDCPIPMCASCATEVKITKWQQINIDLFPVMIILLCSKSEVHQAWYEDGARLRIQDFNIQDDHTIAKSFADFICLRLPYFSKPKPL